MRLSLSGATAEVHDAERGRGSFHRVLLGVGVLTSRGIPTHMSLVIDTRTRAQLRAAAELAESVGAHELHYILPQPVAASVMRDSDLPLEEWDDVRDEVDELAAEGRTHVRIVRDYGFPSDGRRAAVRHDVAHAPVHRRVGSARRAAVSSATTDSTTPRSWRT